MENSNSKELATTQPQAEQLPQVEQNSTKINIFHGFNQLPTYRADAKYKECVFDGYDIEAKESVSIGSRIEGFIETATIKTWYPNTEKQKKIAPYLYISILLKLISGDRAEVNIKVCNLEDIGNNLVNFVPATSPLIAFISLYNIKNSIGQYIRISLNKRETKKSNTICITKVFINGISQNFIQKEFDEEGKNVLSITNVLNGNQYTTGNTKAKREQREKEILSDLLHHFGIAETKQDKDNNPNHRLLKYGGYWSMMLNPDETDKEMDELPF